ncbi:glycine cleavage system aminomethyltransferase GcvT [Sedimentibacter hydroxybenzoicus DSM 7310]|uniref:Aminomethyltransferase n=1 Tax=Sedimentibacter hydroxybenzoicus DSM 7310 TaxID=1123245 RepID=A0A974BLV8_SEDHY|nr:glycine cleavage system aminomethyltransferase GcvT [Sedimentibacter hydroxybenzoicus]NYB75779.1 glycine cleavage system aminomethyltransferase GcvT [Sedimentibacter hydroxybenzoicus DSM 7310]
MKQTPLYENHLELKGKIIDFGGWALPVEYTGILAEHEAVRTKAGLFDVSHMGEITVKGQDAEKYIQAVVTNDITVLTDNQIVYTTMCYTDGGVVDDLLVYKHNNEDYLLVVNASNTDKDYEWFKENEFGNVTVENVSEKYAQLALQGPNAQDILQKLVTEDLNKIEFYHFLDNIDVGGMKTLVSRTGYTGEDGFELYFASEDGPKMWKLLLEAGKEEGLVPAGLGARDTLRFEACLPLYGHEIDRDITPLEAGLGFCVKLAKDNFIGKESLAEQKAAGLKRKLVGFEMVDRGIPRSHYEVYADGNKVGYVTTGSFSPTLKKNIGLALIETAYAKEGTEIEIAVRNRNLKAVVIKKPFYTKKYKK